MTHVLTNASQSYQHGVMAMDRQTAIRLPGDALKRAERLARLLQQKPAYQGLRVTTAAVLRLAMLRGLDEMEREGTGGR
jgi:predicted DNA-binding protein